MRQGRQDAEIEKTMAIVVTIYKRCCEPEVPDLLRCLDPPTRFAPYELTNECVPFCKGPCCPSIGLNAYTQTTYPEACFCDCHSNDQREDPLSVALSNFMHTEANADSEASCAEEHKETDLCANPDSQVDQQEGQRTKRRKRSCDEEHAEVDVYNEIKADDSEVNCCGCYKSHPRKGQRIKLRKGCCDGMVKAESQPQASRGDFCPRHRLEDKTKPRGSSDDEHTGVAVYNGTIADTESEVNFCGCYKRHQRERRHTRRLTEGIVETDTETFVPRLRRMLNHFLGMTCIQITTERR